MPPRPARPRGPCRRCSPASCPRPAWLPTLAKASAECDRIQATCASVSPLCTTVGAPREARAGRIGRPDDRHAAVAGQRGEQGRLLARHQRAGALPHRYLAREVGAHHQVAGESVLLRLGHGPAEAARVARVQSRRTARIASDAPVAKAVMRSPSSTRCGLASASARSPSAVGSAPMRLATATRRSPSAARRAATCRPSGSRRHRDRASRAAAIFAEGPLRPEVGDRALQPAVAAVLAVRGDAGRVDVADARRAAAALRRGGDGSAGRGRAASRLPCGSAHARGGHACLRASGRLAPVRGATLLHQVPRLLRRHRAVDHGVDPDGGRHGAGAHVVRRLQAEARRRRSIRPARCPAHRRGRRGPPGRRRSGRRCRCRPRPGGPRRAAGGSHRGSPHRRPVPSGSSSGWR